MTAAGLMATADDLLRGGPLTASPARPRRLLVQLAVLAVGCGLAYGGVMGSLGGRPLQLLYSAAKVPLLLSVTFALSLPSFFVLNRLLGLAGDFAVVLRGLLVTQAAVAVALASVAPVTALWYASDGDYFTALAVNMAAFAVATLAGQVVLRRWYRPLVARDRRHRAMFRTWLLTYAFVGIQMGWALRPFIGSPGQPTRFFRQPAWGNAYVEVMAVLAGLVR